MNFLGLVADTAADHQGWLTRKILGVTLTSAEWVLWLLVALSVFSLALMLERGLYFYGRRLKNRDELLGLLGSGNLEAVRKSVANKPGMEAAVLRDGVAAASLGADSVEQVIAK